MGRKMTLREARESKGISQTWVAGQMAVTRQTVASWENNPKRIPIGRAKKYCELIGIDIADIFFGEH